MHWILCNLIRAQAHLLVLDFVSVLLVRIVTFALNSQRVTFNFLPNEMKLFHLSHGAFYCNLGVGFFQVHGHCVTTNGPKGWNFRVGKSAYPGQPRVQDSVWLICLSSLDESCVLHLYTTWDVFYVIKTSY